MSTCAVETQDGKRCRARPLTGRPYCFHHDPEQAEKAAEARLKGGKQRAKDVARTVPRGRVDPELPPVQLETKEDAQNLIRKTIDQMRTGQLDAQIAHQVGYLANLFLRSLSEDEAEARIKRLEEMTRPLKGLSPEQLLELVRSANGPPAKE